MSSKQLFFPLSLLPAWSFLRLSRTLDLEAFISALVFLLSLVLKILRCLTSATSACHASVYKTHWSELYYFFKHIFIIFQLLMILYTYIGISQKQKHTFLCFSPPIRGEDGCFLYGVFNGYDGNRVANFASQCLTAELLLGQLNSNHTDNDIRRILTQVAVFLFIVFLLAHSPDTKDVGMFCKT